MSQLSARLACCALALLLVSGCDGGAGNASADAEADKTARFTAAADALSARFEQGIPPAGDPAVTAFEAEAASGLTALGTPALPLDGFDSFDALCGKTAAIVGAWANEGVESLPEAERAARMARNVETHLDHMFTPLLFAAHCTAAHLPFIAETVGNDTSAKAEALGQVRDGAYQQVQGLLEMAGAGDLDEARKRRILDLLAGDADEFAIVLSQARRQELAQGAESIRAAVPEDARTKIDSIKSGFTTPDCGPLCRM